MLRIAALNDTANTEDDPRKIQLTKTKEATEAEAFSAYNKALKYQQKGHLEHAEKLLQNLLIDPFLQEASDLVEDERHSSNHHGLQLLYSIHKNLASIMLERKELQEAMKYYIEAVRIDPSEVTVWYKMGQTACKLEKYQLAKQCYQQALQCNKCHWPSLDQAITVTYALGDYLMCLEHISTALEMDFGYTKGLVLHKQILKEQPSLENMTKELFENCDPYIHTVSLSEAESKEYLDESSQIRSKCRQQVNDYKDEQSRPMAFLEPLIPFTWKHFGQQLIKLYDFATSSKPPKSLALEIDLREYFFLDPSVFFGQDTDNIPTSAQEKEKPKSQEPDVKKANLMVPDTKPDSKSAFQKAKEHNKPLGSIPMTLTLEDEAKGHALKKRLHGEALSNENLRMDENEEGKEGEVPEVKRQKPNRIEEQEEIDLEDITTGNDFDIPLLGDVDMDLDINLSEIKKMELKPDLLLKTRDDDLGIPDAKELDSVLSSVIEMECADKEIPPGGLGSTSAINQKNESILNADKCAGEGGTAANFTATNVSITTSLSPTKGVGESDNESKKDTQATNLVQSKVSPSQVKNQSSRQEQELNLERLTSPSINESNELTSLVSSKEVPKVSVFLEDIPLSSTSSLDALNSNVYLHSGFNKQSPKPVPRTSSSPITSSLLSPFSGDLPTSATIYHSILNQCQKNNSAGSVISTEVPAAAKKNTENANLVIVGSQKPSQNQSQNVDSNEKKNTSPILENPHKVVTPGEMHKDKFKSPDSPRQKPISNTITVSLPSSPVMKSTGDFIEDVVRNQLGFDSIKCGPCHFNPPQATSSHGTSPSSSTETSFTQKLKSFMRPPVSPESSCGTKQPHSSIEGQNSGYAGEGSKGRLDSLKKSLALLNIPEQYLNSLSVMEANTVLQAAADREQILRQLGREHMSPSLSTLSGLSAVPVCIQSSQHASIHPLISPPLAHTGSNPFFPNERPRAMSSTGYPSLLLSPPPRSQAPNVFPPFPLLAHQQDYSFAPYSASLMTSLYPPMSPSSKYPLIPSTSPSYLQSRLLSRTLLDNNPLFPNLNAFQILTSPTSLAMTMTSAQPRGQAKRRRSTSATFSSHPFDPLSSPVKGNVNSYNSTPVGNSEASGQRISQSESLELNAHGKKVQSFQAMLKTMLENCPSQGDSSNVLKSKKSPTGKQTAAPTATSPKLASGSKRGPKRKIMDDGENYWTNAYKRRSMRNRSGRSKKEEHIVDYKVLIKKHFPQSLKQNLEEESDEDCNSTKAPEKASITSESCKNNEVDLSTVKSLSESEEIDVKDLIKECFKRHGLKDIMYKYLLHLAQKFQHAWPEDIAEIYTQIYSRLRKHLTIPVLYDNLEDLSSQVLMKHFTIIVMFCELVLEKASVFKNSRILTSPAVKGDEDEDKKQMRSLLGSFYERDMEFLYLVSRYDSEMDYVLKDLTVRLYWLKAKQHQVFGEILDAIDCFEFVLDFIQEQEKGGEGLKLPIILPNMSEDKVISAATVSNGLDSLHRFDRLENTRKLYDQGNFGMVVNNLLPLFEKRPKAQLMSQKERPSQLLLLQDSLCKLGRHKDCLQWAEFSVAESLTYFQRIKNVHLKQSWVSVLISSLSNVERLMKEQSEIMASLNFKGLVKLAHNLVTIIDINLDSDESIKDMPIDTLLPMKILFRILKYVEDKETKIEEQDKEDDSDEEFQNKPSLQMLLDAHEYFGRHGWCTKDDGSFLLFLMDQIQTQMLTLDEDDREELVVPLEQCILCLYNHPNKKGKSRHLCDHNTKQISLKWDNCGSLFSYFTHDILPEFDSKRTNSISSDVEHLLRRIYNLVPETLNPESQLETVTSFIDGTTTVIPTSWSNFSQSLAIDPDKIQNLLYYLLADFYFKNNEFKKAVKFYQLDLVINASRVDSWAGLALAKKSQIEHELNAIDIKMDSPAPRKWEASLRCFQRAVDLENKNRKLWMEYGFLAYQLHSHASRQTKLRNTFAISGELLATAHLRRKSMLERAYHSFKQAENCERDETSDDWLVYYMLGKIAEKQREKPSVFLQHYIKAARCLHEEKAVYPKKIVFTSIPPHLALESLEVYYRIHASILKLLLKDALLSEDMPSVDTFLVTALKGEFATCEGKYKETLEDDKDDVFSSQSFKSSCTKSSTQSSSQTKTKPLYHRNPMDHEYSFFKSTSDSQSSDNPDASSQDESQPASFNYGSKDAVTSDSREKDYEDNEKDYGNSMHIRKESKDMDIPAADIGSFKSEGQDVTDLSRSNPTLEIATSGIMSSQVTIPTSLTSVKQGSLGGTFAKPTVFVNMDAMGVVKEDGNRATEISDATKNKLESEGQIKAIIMDMDFNSYHEKNVSEVKYSDTLHHDSDSIGSHYKTLPYDSAQVSYLMDQTVRAPPDKSVTYQSLNQQSNEPIKSQSHSGDVKETVIDINNQAIDIPKADIFNKSKILHKQISEGFSPGLSTHEIAIDENMETDEKLTLKKKNAGVNQVDSTDLNEVRETIVVDYSWATGNDDVSNVKVAVESEITTSQEKADKLNAKKESEGQEGASTETSVTDKEKWEDEDKEKNKYDSEREKMKNEARENKDGDREKDKDNEKKEEGNDGQETDKAEGIEKNKDGETARDNDNKMDPDIEKQSVSTQSNNMRDLERRQLVDMGDNTKARIEPNEHPTIIPHSSNDEREKDPKGLTTSQSDDPLNIANEEEDKTAFKKELPEQYSSQDESVSVSGVETVSSKGDSSKQNDDKPTPSKEEITQKCISGLQLCASRFLSHHKSLYCLAQFYHGSSDNKNLQFARDLLLGRADWQQQSYMPAPGLFAERKLNNFFQGLWKIPNDDIDRPGCFASHVFQSVRLLLRILCELCDYETLKFVREQLKRNPDSTKKYLRDAERQALVEEAYKRMLEVLDTIMKSSEDWSEEKREENLACMYRLWLLGKGSKHAKEGRPLLLQAFRIMMKGRTDVNRLTADQAVSYCKQNISKTLIQTPVAGQTGKERPRTGQSGNTADRGKPATTERKRKFSETTSTTGPVIIIEPDAERPTEPTQNLANKELGASFLTSSSAEILSAGVNPDFNTRNDMVQASSQETSEIEGNEDIIVISDAG